MTRLPLLVLLCSLTTGCVSLDWGIYPRGSGPGIEILESSVEHCCSTRIRTPDVQARIDLETYTPYLGFIGLLVPVIPFYPVPAFPLLFTPDRLKVRLELEGGTEQGFVRPDTLRVTIDGQQYAPQTIRVGHSVWRADQRLPATDRAWVEYDFTYLHSPRDPFSISMEGLPTVDYAPDSDWRLIHWSFY